MSNMLHLLLITASSYGLVQPLAQLDCFGDRLPGHAIARMGTLRLRHGDRVCGICFSHDEKSLFSAGSDNTVRQWDVVTGKLLCKHTGHNLCFRTLAISPDGKLLAAAGGSADCRIYLWEAGTGKQLEVLKNEMDIAGLIFSADSKTLAWITLQNRLVLFDRISKSQKDSSRRRRSNNELRGLLARWQATGYRRRWRRGPCARRGIGKGKPAVDT